MVPICTPVCAIYITMRHNWLLVQLQKSPVSHAALIGNIIRQGIPTSVGGIPAAPISATQSNVSSVKREVGNLKFDLLFSLQLAVKGDILRHKQHQSGQDMN
jgi:hypothetical protein